MNNNFRTVDGKNAVLILDGNNISIVYKNAFGTIIEGHSKRVDFTYDDVQDIEFKKPGISMNGFILFVLKNDEIHKIALTKLDEFSFEVTDEMVKQLQAKLGNHVHEVEDEPIELEPELIFMGLPALQPKKKEEKDKDKKDVKYVDGKPVPITKPNPTLTPGVKPPIPNPTVLPTVAPPRDKERNKQQAYIEPSPIPKTKEEIEKEKIREELNKRIRENKEKKLQEEQERIGVKTPTKEQTVGIGANVVITKPDTKVYVEEAKPVAINPLKQEELDLLEKAKHDIIIDELENKLLEVEQELKSLMYFHMILESYINTAEDKEDIERTIRKIEELIAQLEAIKKEIINKMDGKEYIVNMQLDVTGDGKVDVDDFKTIYVKTLDKITEFERVLDEQKERAMDKKDEIQISDEEYEKNFKKVMNQLQLTEKYDAIIGRTRNYVRRINQDVGHRFEEMARFYTVNIREFRHDTRVLMELSAASMLIPGTGPARGALMTAAGLAAVRDMLLPETELRRETYYQPIDYSQEINRGIRDARDARKYINDSKRTISEIKKEIDNNLKNHPDYNTIMTELDKVELEVDRQDKELRNAEIMLRNQANRNRSHVLKLELENPQY